VRKSRKARWTFTYCFLQLEKRRRKKENTKERRRSEKDVFKKVIVSHTESQPP
jgi:hypothetical protein